MDCEPVVAISNGNLNIECAVQPLTIRVAAMPDEATPSATFPVILTLARNKFRRNVLPENNVITC